MFYGIGSLNIAGGVNPASIAYWAHGVGLVMVQFWCDCAIAVDGVQNR